MWLNNTLRTILLSVVATSVACAQQAEDDVYHQGDVVLEEIPRYNDLPTRFLLRPEFALPVDEPYFDDRFLEFFVRILKEDHDDELHYQAASSLERVAREKLAEPEKFVAVLRDQVQNNANPDIRRICAMALVAADSTDDADDLAALCRPNDPVLCAAVEPWLAAQKPETMTATWESRIRAHRTTARQLLMLACNGLAAAGRKDATSSLTTLAMNDRVSFAVRRAAAAAVADLSPQEAHESAVKLASAGIRERLLATVLLKNSETESSLDVLLTLADDKENAVASAAWTTLVRQSPERLLPKLPDGQKHKDPNVRLAVIRTIELLPTGELCDMLSQFTGDLHIDVRNEARRTLQRLAVSRKDLTDRILANAGDITARTDAGWQELEQSQLLLGCLKHDVYQDNCIGLLQHERAEVRIAAAWLLHLMPQKHLGEPAAQEAIRRWKSLTDGSLPEDEAATNSIQISYLCEVAARTDARSIINLCNDMFDKEVPASPETRAIALWTLGVLMTDSKDGDLREKYLGRLFDDSILNPEVFIVRSASALALGRLGDRAVIPELERGHASYGYDGNVGKSISTALRRFGFDIPPVRTSFPVLIGDWPVAPTLPDDEQP